MDENSDQAQYPSLVEEGRVLVEIPEMQNLTGDGPYPNSDMRGVTKMERLQVRDFPGHVCQKVETAFKRQGPAAACATLSHYQAHGKAILLDAASAQRMSELVNAMSKSTNPQRFYESDVRPWLMKLQPHARQR
jgi:hypothetical protein